MMWREAITGCWASRRPNSPSRERRRWQGCRSSETRTTRNTSTVTTRTAASVHATRRAHRLRCRIECSLSGRWCVRTITPAPSVPRPQAAPSPAEPEQLRRRARSGDVAGKNTSTRTVLLSADTCIAVADRLERQHPCEVDEWLLALVLLASSIASRRPVLHRPPLRGVIVPGGCRRSLVERRQAE